MTSLFEMKVDEQVERLQKLTLQEIENEVTRKRLDWMDKRFPGSGDPGIHIPRQAFQLLFFEYMGLDPQELPIVAETQDEIVWDSINPCPTLEACRLLSLDTRIVCRAAYDKSTQAFLTRLDPRLQFIRSYAEIRPYAPYCRERIVRIKN